MSLTSRAGPEAVHSLRGARCARSTPLRTACTEVRGTEVLQGGYPQALTRHRVMDTEGPAAQESGGGSATWQASLLGTWAAWGAGGAPPNQVVGRRPRPTSYNERTLLNTKRPMYRDWKGDAGQDSKESDLEYKERLQNSDDNHPAPAAAAAPRLAKCPHPRSRVSSTAPRPRAHPRKKAARRAAKAAPAAQPQALIPNMGDADESWRLELKPGSRVDARDNKNNWYETKVESIDGDKLTIHFLGWSKKWDITVDRFFDGIRPLGTVPHVEETRTFKSKSRGSGTAAATAAAAAQAKAKATTGNSTRRQPAATTRLARDDTPSATSAASTTGRTSRAAARSQGSGTSSVATTTQRGSRHSVARLDIKGASSMGVVSDDGSVSTRKSARAGLAVKITTGNAAPKRVREVKATPAVLAAAASTASASRKRKKPRGETKPNGKSYRGTIESQGKLVEGAGKNEDDGEDEPGDEDVHEVEPEDQNQAVAAADAADANAADAAAGAEAEAEAEVKAKAGAEYEAGGEGEDALAVRTNLPRVTAQSTQLATHLRHANWLGLPTLSRVFQESHENDVIDDGEDDAVEEQNDPQEQQQDEEPSLVQRAATAWSRVTSAFVGSPLAAAAMRATLQPSEFSLGGSPRSGSSPRGGVRTGQGSPRPARAIQSAIGQAKTYAVTEFEGQSFDDRFKYWDKARLNKAQHTCRERGLWPGGDKGNVRDRLLNFEFSPAELTDRDYFGPNASALRPSASVKPKKRSSAVKDKFKCSKYKANKISELPLSYLLGPDSITGGSASPGDLMLHELVANYRGAFLENVDEFLATYAVELELPSIESQLTEVLAEDYPGYEFTRGWRVQVRGSEEAPGDSFVVRIYENLAREGCEHCTCSRWGERPLTMKTYHFMVVSEPPHLSHPVLSLHGMIHANGFGHLLHVNGKEVGSQQSGTLLMDVWDGMCIGLGASQVSLQDMAMKHGLHLRLIHTIAYNHNWYGRWGYTFQRGSYGNTTEHYSSALETMQQVSVDAVKDDCTEESGLGALLEQYTASGEVQTIAHLFRHVLDLLRSNSLSQNVVVFEHLALFTRGILFGESFDVTAGDGRKTAVKRAREMRRCSQVLLDCRWFAKKFLAQRRELHVARRASPRHAAAAASNTCVTCTLAAHLKIQVACDTQQPVLELEMPPGATTEDLKELATKYFRLAYPPLANFNARTVRIRGTSKPLSDDLLLADIVSPGSNTASSLPPLPLVYEVIGNGVDSSRLTPIDHAIVSRSLPAVVSAFVPGPDSPTVDWLVTYAGQVCVRYCR